MVKVQHVKVDDNVFVLTGKDAGKTGKVLSINRATGRIIVEGVNIVTKHQRPDMRLGTGGIVRKEAGIDASNVMVVCPNCKRPSKTGRKFEANGDKVRFCKACSATIDTIRKGSK